MELLYPTKQLWRKTVSPDTPALSGKKLKRLNQLLKNQQLLGITHEIKALDESYLEWFLPFYEAGIQSKNNGHVYDVKERTLDNVGSKYPFLALEIKQNGLRVGGSIFSCRDKSGSVAFKMYQPGWNSGNAQLTPSQFSEHLMYQWALENQKPFLLHGQDRNPYGLNSAIGLCEYKLSVGYIPMLPKKAEVANLQTEEINQDILCFLLPEKGKRLSKNAVLLCNQETLPKYEKLQKYQDIFDLQVITR